MSTPQLFPFKKAFLYSLVASVVFSALLGILAILSGNWDWFQVRILLTTVTISGASICGLACGAYLATQRGRTLPLTGIALALAGAAMLIAGMWIEARSEHYWKLAVSVSVFAVAAGHLALLSMARLAEWFLWSLVVAYAVILGVASLIVLLIWAEFHGAGMFQLLGVAAIVDAAITILIPIFHWLSRAQVSAARPRVAQASPESIEAEIARLKARIAELERQQGRG
jgi:hypothetical protein